MNTFKSLGLVALTTLSAQAADFGLGIHIRPDVNGYGFHVPIKHQARFSSVVSVDFNHEKIDLTLLNVEGQKQDRKSFALEYALYREVYSRDALSVQAGFCLGVSSDRSTREQWREDDIFSAKDTSKGYHLGPRTNVEYSLTKHVSVNWGVGLLYGRDSLTQTQGWSDEPRDADGSRKRFFLDSNLSLRVYF
jgi:hypothetical protein